MANSLNLKNSYIFDGVKNITLEQYPDEAWTFLTGKPADEVQNYYKAIPWMYRAVDIRAKALSGLPFALVTKGGDDYDVSNDWQNKVGFLPDPTQLLYLIESSLVLTGRAYVYRQYNRARTIHLQYLSPIGIEPKLDPIDGLTGFIRYLSTGQQNLTLDDLVYFYLPDPYVEVGPPTAYPAKAALMACGVLANLDELIAGFFKRGAIRATLLTIEGNSPEPERKRLADWWKKAVGGVKNAFGANVFNAAVKPVVIGDGISEFDNEPFTPAKREDICNAFGVPITLLWSNAANYATAQQDELTFITKTVAPQADRVAQTLNDQLFGRMNLRFEFRPDELEVMQESEEQRAGALSALTSVLAQGEIGLIAMDILGYDIPDDTRAKLEAMFAEEEQEPEPEPEQQPEAKPEVEEEEPEEEEEEVKSVKPSEAEQIAAELRTWERFALKRGNKGREFKTEHVPDALAGAIQGGLDEAKSLDEIKAVFAGVWAHA